MEVHESGRSAFVLQVESGEAEVAINQPSDCLVLQTAHIVSEKVVTLHAWFGYSFTSKIYGPPQPEPPEVWHKAVCHLLDTYRPHYCYIYAVGIETGLDEEVNVEVDAQICYRGLWDAEENVLSMRR